MQGEVALEVRGLTRSYGRRVAVDRLDLQVLTGDVYGFLGPNGAGKTTAMRCITGLIRMDDGEVSVFGESRPIRARRDVGAIIEVPAFHRWMTGRENLQQACAYMGLGRKRTQEEIARVLERVGLAERASDKAGTYSLGMKQRLGIARALLDRPRLLLLDEPTNGLDPRGMREVRDLIRSLALHDEITVFISSHLLAEVQHICNRVGIIQEGRLRAEGRVEELLSSENRSATASIGCADAEGLRTALEAIEQVSILGPGEHGRLKIDHSGLALADLNRQLVEAGLAIDAVVPDIRSLEDVFLEVTR